MKLQLLNCRPSVLVLVCNMLMILFMIFMVLSDNMLMMVLSDVYQWMSVGLLSYTTINIKR